MSAERLRPLFHAVAAVILTWPLAAHITDSLPLGIEPGPTVPLFNLWTMRWNQQQTGNLFRNYWDAPIFHPTSGAFALSEPQPLTGLVFTPISWVTHNPTFAYNVVLLLILMLNGLAAARLARRVGVAPAPALLAGVIAQSLPFVATQLGVLQLTAVFPIFYLIDAVLAWAPEGGRRKSLAVGGWLAATFLTCGYYGLLSLVVLGLSGLTLMRRSWLSWTRLIDSALAAGLFAAVAGPVLLSQGRYTDPYARSYETVLGLSAEPVDFLRLRPNQQGPVTVPWLRGSGGSSHYLYPGTVLMLLAAAGLLLRLSRSARRPSEERDQSIDKRRGVAFLLNAAGIAFILSLGLRVNVAGFRPYDVLRMHVPGFRSLRSPFRFAALMQVCLVPLGAMALDSLWRWTAKSVPKIKLGAAMAVLVVVAGVIEVTPVPQRLFVVAESRGDWVSWLADQPRFGESGDGSVAMVPFPANGAVESYESTAEAMLSGLDHGRPLVNGYSGIFPDSYSELETLMAGFPSEASVRGLRDLRVTYIVVERSWLTPQAQVWMSDWSRELTRVYDGRDKVIYRLNP